MTPTEVLGPALIILAWLMALSWLHRSVMALRGMASVLDLTAIEESLLPALPESEGPDVTVVVPARDEQDSIQATLESLLSSEGIRAQIIAIDDRSEDRTGELMDAVASRSHHGANTLEVIHNRVLPQGWLGKPHALALGVARARAQWLLFTDGDVTFAPEALELALRAATKTGSDHFVVVPTLTHEGVLAAGVQGSLQVLGQWAARMWKVQDPDAKDFFGVGGFNLLRVDTLEAFGGMERLRMEIVEDVSLGWLVKRELGRRSMMVLGPGLVKIAWMQGPFGIVSLLEKNAFAGNRYSIGITVGASVFLFSQAVVPLLALAAGPWGVGACLTLYGSVAMSFHANRKLNGISPILAILYAPTVLILVWSFLRSMFLTIKRGGVAWRGTLYPLAELKRAMIPWRIR
ncbi:MAG TPA: glycosyltransferase family 2 protein [Terracidiphilus sp.]|nr:glycosyltransferase family 2 protein [Terracidiphilus sp.]